MQAKEKAKEIVDKMLSKSPNIQDGISRIDIIYAKLCAKIHINGLVEYAKTFGDVTDLDIKEFNEVLKEIDNI